MKTVLSSILIHHLENETRERCLPILSLYLDSKTSNVQTIPNLFGSLLKQLIQLEELYPISDELRNLYQKATRLDLRPRSYLEDLRRIFAAEVDRYDRFYVVVDGLDEFPSRERMTLLKELQKIRPEKLSLVVMSRPIAGDDVVGLVLICDRCNAPNIKVYYRCKICNKGNYDVCRACIKEGLSCLDPSHKLIEPYDRVKIQVVIPERDIERYVRWEIGAGLEDVESARRDERLHNEPLDTTPFQDLCLSDPELPDKIVSAVVEKASGRFLFARLHIDALKMMSNLRKLRKVLNNFPEDLDGIYKEAMQRVQAQEKGLPELANKILGLLTCMRRTVSLGELQHALAVVDTKDDVPNEESEIFGGIEPKKRILDSTCGLVIIENEENEVRLVHRSLEDYLKRGENRTKWFPKADIEMAQACMIYLGLVISSETHPNEYFASQRVKFPFLQYSSQYWGDHARDAASNPDVREAALRILDNPRHLVAIMRAAWVTDPGGHDSWDVSKSVDRLHVCAWYGLSFAISISEPEDQLVDVVESNYGQTPLMYACRKGHVETVKKLLDLGASLAKTSSRGRTPMLEAVLENHDSVVKVLVDRRPLTLDINAIHTEKFNRTALILAANAGHFKIAEVLLAHPHIKVNIQDIYGMSALEGACRSGCLKIVEDLLMRPEIEIDSQDFDAGRSALRCAAERNFSQIVELLLSKGANPDLNDHVGGTAMLRAVNRGCEQALETMISHGVNLDCVDEDGQTLLHGASQNGHASIARLLMDHGLSPNISDSHGLTSLHYASQHNQNEVLHLLLSYGADPYTRDEFNRTPYDIAYQYSHPATLSLLSNIEKSTVSGLPQEFRHTNSLPIWSLARLGLLTELTAALTSQASSDILVTEPGNENTVLHCALHAETPEILSLLLSSPFLPAGLLNKPNHYGRTPLHLAALNGNMAATTLLLGHSPSPDLDVKDRWHSTPLLLAQANTHFPVMLALIEAGAAIDTQRIRVQEVFFFAAEAGQVNAAKRLLECGADRDGRNKDGVTAVQIAVAGGDKRMEFWLKEEGKDAI